RSEPMPYCPDCGVEIGKTARCPLCGALNPRAEQAEGECACQDEVRGSSTLAEPMFEHVAPARTFSPVERRKVAWEVLTVAFSIAIFVLGAVNLVDAGHLSWSLYPITSLLLIWTEATSMLMLRDHPLTAIIVSAAAPPCFILALGYITGSPRWALGLGLPIALLVESVSGGVVLAIMMSKRKGLDVLGFVAVGAALVCMGIEICIDLYARGQIRMGWSAICALTLLPIAAFLFYLHHRVAKTTNLRRLFRL
ncbi:MAG: DUF6320 domain-containing protein, partial [Spirochaetales bacterium]|nr:DUF6320 domain-containing protein [Spirochaetales bacterium]